MNSISFRNSLASRIGLPLEDWLTGTNIVQTSKLLKTSQFWEEDVLESYRLAKLKKILKFSFENVPYYKDISQINRLNLNDFQSCKDINLLPVLTKEVALDRWKDLIPSGLNMRGIKIGKTGGTTGSPMIVYKDSNSRSFVWASYYRWYDWMGVSLGDNVSSFWGARTVTKKSKISALKMGLQNSLFNQKKYDSFKMNDETVESYTKSLLNSQPVLIKGYLSALLLVAEKLLQESAYQFPRLRAVSSTTETLLPMHRDFLMKTFKVPVYDQYGCGEIGGVAYECSFHRGLHINQEHVIVEVLDHEFNNTFGATGQLVITDLDNYSMPFLRYANGDLGTLSEEVCGCGVNQPLLKRIDGRAIDTIELANGSKVHGVFFTDIFYELGITSDQITRFQVYQEKRGEIELRLLSKKGTETLSKDKIQLLESSMRPFFKKIEIIFCDEISAEPNGKFKYIKSNLN